MGIINVKFESDNPFLALFVTTLILFGTVLLYVLMIVAGLLAVMWMLQTVTGFPIFDLMYTCDMACLRGS